MKIPFKQGNILIPKNIDMHKWSVVACDQYTSEPNYWNEVKAIVDNNPSSLNLILPEIYLNENNLDKRIKNINKNMQTMVDKKLFKEYKNTMIYVERKQDDGQIREGIIGVVDLEKYSFEKGSQTPIRATEKTIIERIPPRMKVREKALLELPHIMILIDDDKKDIIESLKKEVTDKDIVYDFDLMQKGGHIKGYTLNKESINNVKKKLELLADKKNFEKKYNVNNKKVLLLAVGDGNHSLATAKSCYEKIKKELPRKEYLKHPARYALVELVNLHSPALQFEEINRVLFDIDVDNFIDSLYKYYDINSNGNGQKFELITKDMNKTLYISNPKANIPVGSIQLFIDEYLQTHKGTVDYIHGKDITRELGSKDNNIGIIFEPMAKEELFKTVIVDGVLPRKTFSMGHSYDKRFYLEARIIKKSN